MKNRFAVLASFLASLCAVCSFLVLALLLGSMTGCSATGAAATPPSDPSAPTEPLSSPPATDAVVQSPAQPSAEQPPIQSATALESAPIPDSPAPSGQNTSENGIYAVLQGKASFYSTDAAQDLSISELGRAVSDDSGITAKALKFTTVDLNSDSVLEVVLWLQVNENDAFGFEILRQQGGQIYGYTLPYRAFMDLKQDGTFSFSSGAADSGFGTISFSDKTYAVHNTTYSQSGYDANNELTVSYFVNNQAASEADYLAAVERQAGKESVIWSDFTDENIASSGIALWRQP